MILLFLVDRAVAADKPFAFSFESQLELAAWQSGGFGSDADPTTRRIHGFRSWQELGLKRK